MAEAGQSSITVAVRVRPFTIREAAQLQKNDDGTIFLGDGSLAAAPTPKLNQRGIRNVIKVVDDRCLIFDPPEDSPVQRFSRTVVPASKKVKDQVFAFDRVFDEGTSQSEVYEGTTRCLLDSVLDGYNATVFAYGATGCGKTHTITGTAQQPGIIFLTMQELFEKIEERSQEKCTEVTLSYLEIYNETIRDLLVPGGSKAGLTLREDSNAAVTVAGLTSHRPKDVQEVMDMIVQGNEYRTVSPTEANATSSRSHAVLQINLAQKDRNAHVNEPHTMATLSIIDLAGSERASVTKNRGERLTEGANINKSLLALGSCINALCDKRQKQHVPYRNSKLTRLLKFSLGGNCKTVMIVCVSPSSAHYDESQNTLRYANRAKNIQTKVTRNVFNVNRHVKDFLIKIDEQMALINELRAQQKDAENLFYAKFRKQGERREIVAKEGLQRLRAAFDNSAAERQERISDSKKLKTIERRIGLLSAWMSAFEGVADERGDGDSMPQNLSSLRKTAYGILLELENSRHHLRQKLEKSSWERQIDTALTHGLKQLETEGTDHGEVSRLVREADILKANFNSEVYREELEQEKAGDAPMMQMLLTAQFDMLASFSDALGMDEEKAMTQAKEVMSRLLKVGFTAVGQVVKPDGSLPVCVPDPFSPTRKGTPKKRRSINSYVKPYNAPPAGAVQSEAVFASPMKSPRRRKAMGLPRKGVSFTPTKKTKGRGVRWRDDETADGTLADFEKTPEAMPSSPTSQRSPVRRIPAPKTTATVSPQPARPAPSGEHSSPSQDTGDESSFLSSKSSRFQAGFLSKGGRLAHLNGAHASSLPSPPSLRLSLASSSPESGAIPALRSLDVAKAANLSPPQPSRIAIRRSPPQTLPVILDENNVQTSGSSDSESPGVFDISKLRSAIYSAKKDKPRRSSLLAVGGAPAARRVSSAGSLGGEKSVISRPSLPSLASSANGISRHRRASLERRRSPPLPCSPTDLKIDKTLTAGQARRMNMGGGLRLENMLPSQRVVGFDMNRRVTISMGTVGTETTGSVTHRRLTTSGSLALR